MRQDTEIATLKTLAAEFKTKGYSIKDAFDHLDTNTGGTITLGELSDALKVMKLQLSN